MAETIGKIIKYLRKERNWTQKELAERIGVTTQAISKWESEAGLPDISQIVPLASVFGVSADVLFGISQNNEDEEAIKIIKEARAYCRSEANLENCRLWRNRLLEGLKYYPTNTKLLMECLESGICLSYPANEMYDKENGKDIYLETVKHAKLVEKYSRNINDIMRANMITVLLHSAYGDFETANEQAKKFPTRCDMTDNCMKSYIAESEKEYNNQIVYLQSDLFYHLEALLDILSRMGAAYYKTKDYDLSEEVFLIALNAINSICGTDNLPPFHRRNSGDIYTLLAQVYLAEGDTEKALDMLERTAEYDLNEPENYDELQTPTFNKDHLPYKTGKEKTLNQLLLRLSNPAFDRLKESERYIRLINRIKSVQGEI